MNVFSTKSGKRLKMSSLSFLAEQMYTLKQVNPADGDVYHSSANDALTQKKNRCSVNCHRWLLRTCLQLWKVNGTGVAYYEPSSVIKKRSIDCIAYCCAADVYVRDEHNWSVMQITERSQPR